MIDFKDKMRAVSRSLLVTVFAYLCSHALKFVVTAWEFIDFTSLSTVYFDLWLLSTDLISILTLLNCASHLPIYLVFDGNIHNALRRTLQGPKWYALFMMKGNRRKGIVFSFADYPIGMTAVSTQQNPQSRFEQTGFSESATKTGTQFDELVTYMSAGIRIEPKRMQASFCCLG